MKNYYRILELSENASKEVIEKAYKTLVKKYHPDTKTENNKRKAEEKLKELNEAYGVLSDVFLKEQYDNELWEERQRKKHREASLNKRDNQDRKQNDYRWEESTEQGMKGLVEELFIKNPFWKKVTKISSIDILALVLTILILIIIAFVLFALPFTHDWMMKNFIDTPITQAIVKLLST